MIYGQLGSTIDTQFPGLCEKYVIIIVDIFSQQQMKYRNYLFNMLKFICKIFFASLARILQFKTIK